MSIVPQARIAEAAGAWPAASAVDSVTLDYDARHRRRFRLATDGGTGFLLALDRVRLLREGDGLLLDDGRWIAVREAEEDVIEAWAVSPVETLRLAWHLGNRHLPVQVLDNGRIRFRHDHVIADMVRGLGGRAERVRAPFTPEDGAYAAGGHGGHRHDHHHHDHAHDQDHGHDHAHDHGH